MTETTSKEFSKGEISENYKEEIKNLTFLCVKKTTAKSLIKDRL